MTKINNLMKREGKIFLDVVEKTCNKRKAREGNRCEVNLNENYIRKIV